MCLLTWGSVGEGLMLKGHEGMTSTGRDSPVTDSLTKETKECVTWIYLSGLLGQCQS